MFPSLQAVSTPSGSPGPTVAPPVVTAYRVDTGNAKQAPIKVLKVLLYSWCTSTAMHELNIYRDLISMFFRLNSNTWFVKQTFSVL